MRLIPRWQQYLRGPDDPEPVRATGRGQQDVQNGTGTMTAGEHQNESQSSPTAELPNDMFMGVHSQFVTFVAFGPEEKAPASQFEPYVDRRPAGRRSPPPPPAPKEGGPHFNWLGTLGNLAYRSIAQASVHLRPFYSVENLPKGEAYGRVLAQSVHAAIPLVGRKIGIYCPTTGQASYLPTYSSRFEDVAIELGVGEIKKPVTKPSPTPTVAQFFAPPVRRPDRGVFLTADAMLLPLLEALSARHRNKFHANGTPWSLWGRRLFDVDTFAMPRSFPQSIANNVGTLALRLLGSKRPMADRPTPARELSSDGSSDISVDAATAFQALFQAMQTESSVRLAPPPPPERFSASYRLATMKLAEWRDETSRELISAFRRKEAFVMPNDEPDLFRETHLEGRDWGNDERPHGQSSFHFFRAFRVPISDEDCHSVSGIPLVPWVMVSVRAVQYDPITLDGFNPFRHPMTPHIAAMNVGLTLDLTAAYRESHPYHRSVVFGGIVDPEDPRKQAVNAVLRSPQGASSEFFAIMRRLATHHSDGAKWGSHRYAVQVLAGFYPEQYTVLRNPNLLSSHMMTDEEKVEMKEVRRVTGESPSRSLTCEGTAKLLRQYDVSGPTSRLAVDEPGVRAAYLRQGKSVSGFAGPGLDAAVPPILSK